MRAIEFNEDEDERENCCLSIDKNRTCSGTQSIDKTIAFNFF